VSSHREAPQISKDPAADSTDLYAFVSPDVAGTVTIIANYVPLETPGGGPNFYEFADDVLYAVHIDNTGDGVPNISYEFRFTTVNRIPSSFLYNDGPITALTGAGAANWNRQQTYSLTRVNYGPQGWPFEASRVLLGEGLPVPPCNIGPLSTPNYATNLAVPAIVSVASQGYSATVFCGQRADGFYVDLGAVFDLGDLRPFEEAHNMFGLPATGLMSAMPGVNSLAASNVHSLALQVPIDQLTRNSSTPNSVNDPAAVIGAWTTASRQKVEILDGSGGVFGAGPFAQVSRLGNPLINELLIGIGQKDFWNTQFPAHDKQFVGSYSNPLLAQLLPVLYPGVFPNLARYNTVNGSFATNANGPDRADLVAILLTGIPSTVLPSAPTFSGTGVEADELRLNVAVPPSKTSNLGALGGDIGGFPNGRRVFDDVATIELIAVAGASLGLVDPKFSPDAAAKPGTNVSFGLTSSPTDTSANGTVTYLPTFPYLGTPWSGMWSPLTTPKGNLVNPAVPGSQ